MSLSLGTSVNFYKNFSKIFYKKEKLPKIISPFGMRDITFVSMFAHKESFFFQKKKISKKKECGTNRQLLHIDSVKVLNVAL
jgi:hypothetical protein